MTSNQLTLGKLREDIRHNKASETLGYATLGETKRHNVQSESIGFGNIGLGYAQVEESKRHNIASEAYQGEQARAYADKARTDATYTEMQITHYIDELKVKQDNAEANLRNAATAEQRAAIEQQIADIKKDMSYWEKERIKVQNFKDVTEGASNVVDIVGDVVGLLK